MADVVWWGGVSFCGGLQNNLIWFLSRSHYGLIWALYGSHRGGSWVLAGSWLDVCRLRYPLYLLRISLRTGFELVGDWQVIGLRLFCGMMGGMKVEKPWGYEELFALTPQYAGKVIFVKKGHRLSLQYHRVKDETMFIYSGLVKLTIGKGVFVAGAWCQPIPIKPGEVHRIEALEDTMIFEVSTPELDDVVRVEDDYGRVE